MNRTLGNSRCWLTASVKSPCAKSRFIVRISFEEISNVKIEFLAFELGISSRISVMGKAVPSAHTGY